MPIRIGLVSAFPCSFMLSDRLAAEDAPGIARPVSQSRKERSQFQADHPESVLCRLLRGSRQGDVALWFLESERSTAFGQVARRVQSGLASRSSAPRSC